MTKKLACLFLTIFLSSCLAYEPYDSVSPQQKKDVIILMTEADVTHTPNLNQYLYCFLLSDEVESVDEEKRQEIMEKYRRSSSLIENKNALYFGKGVFQNMGYTVLDEDQISSTEDWYCVIVDTYLQSTREYRGIIAHIYKVEKGGFGPETVVWSGTAANILSSDYSANPKYYWTKLFSYYGKPSFTGKVSW